MKRVEDYYDSEFKVNLVMILVSFLKANSVYAEYRHFYYRHMEECFCGKDIGVANHIAIPRNFISSAFAWNRTGDEAKWCRLNKKWNDLIALLEVTNYEISEDISRTFFSRSDQGR